MLPVPPVVVDASEGERGVPVLQDLVCLFDIYLTPLQSETFLSEDEVSNLCGHVKMALSGGE